MKFAAPSSSFAAVSAFTAHQWEASVTADVVLNGVDTSHWLPGVGGKSAVWFGRIVPEKAPHLAIEAAQKAGIPLNLAGPALDDAYFVEEIAPRLGATVRYLGHLPSDQLIGLVGRSAVSVVSPRWDEPYGLVAAESMACGTPVAAFERGGIPEIMSASASRLARPNDASGLAAAMVEAATLSREEVREHAVRHCSLDAMVERYETLYSDREKFAA